MPTQHPPRRLAASGNTPRFEYEGAFRSWLVRVLIDEALVLLGEKQQIPGTNISREADVLRKNCMSAAENNAYSDGRNQVPQIFPLAVE